MTLLRPLTDVDVPGPQAERPCDRLPLVLQGRARQMELPVFWPGFGSRAGRNRIRNPVSSLGTSTMPSWGRSAIS